MKRIKTLALLPIALLLLAAGCGRGKHFITDKSYRDEVYGDYMSRMENIGFAVDGLDTLTCAEREAMEFLYAYMPYSDMADYDGEFFLKQVQYAFEAREAMPWGKNVPEDIFRHFVLVYRVNNENLDTARAYFYHQLKERVEGLSMYDAALEVNHWCHEHVAYRASDSRTSAPLATLRTSLGRCGEESTFAVTALRAVGIPARQCYTPRWAHCDDNHAWVEVYIADSNKWYFLGACEPDPELNMGWFAVPSTRCLMVHSKAFGKYKGDEEVVKRTGLYSELNLLSHYAPTRRITATVEDADGKPLKGAEVKFKMYNYAEYYTLATYTADENGQASLTTGLGDLMVWATDGERYSFGKIDVRRDSTITLRLDGTADWTGMIDLDIVPPVAGNPPAVASEDAINANAMRLAYEDSLRGAYTATFPTKENYKQHVKPNPNLTDEQTWEILCKSEGNYAEIAKFLNSQRDESLKTDMQFLFKREVNVLYDYLCTFSDKDLRDINAEVFEAFFPNDGPWPYDVFKKGILPARISNELIRPYSPIKCKTLWNAFANMKAEEIRGWVLENVIVDDTGNYYNCPISPVGVYKLRHADKHSRDIFYVAACRAVGVPAYLDNATNTIYTWNGSEWQSVGLDSSNSGNSANGKARLTLTYRGKEPAKPIYWPHFTIAKLENGDLRTFDFEDDSRMASFPATIEIEPGTYCLSTGNRYTDGTVLSRMEFFTVAEGENVSKEIVLRPLTPRNDPSSLPCLSPTLKVDGKTTLAEYAGKQGCIVAFLGPHREPAKHLVLEMVQHSDQFAAWGGRCYFTTTDPNNAELRRIATADVAAMGANEQTDLEKSLAKALKLDSYQYPLVAAIGSNGRILFHSNGYSIGLAEQLLKSLK